MYDTNDNSAPPRFDVIGIGNAIVDVIAQEDDSYLQRFGLTKGSMSLVDRQRSQELYEAMSNSKEIAGGSASNTVRGLASFGASSAFIGKVADDDLGASFIAESQANGVTFAVEPAQKNVEPTGRSMIIVTPDGQRTMNTFLGAATTLYRSDIPVLAAKNTAIVFCEGYIWDVEVTKDAIRYAIAHAKESGAKISFTLSDTFCIERHFDQWHELLDNDIDILFGNEEELKTLTRQDTFEKAIEAVRGRCEILCATRSKEGSWIVTADETIKVAAEPVDKVIDTTGAGDQYAAGFLYGFTQGMTLFEAATLGSKAAAEVIIQIGAVPQRPLAELLSR